jgi:hypothetical protein
MVLKPKPTSSKPFLRWPWSKKRKDHLTVDQHPDQEPTEQVDSEESNAGRIQSAPIGSVQGTLPIVVASNSAIASISGERRPEDPSSRVVSESSTSGPQITQATVTSTEAMSSFLPNASGCVFHSLQINAHQHGLESNSNDPGEFPVPYICHQFDSSEICRSQDGND